MSSAIETRYKPSDIDIPEETLRDLQGLSPRTSMLWLGFSWAQIILLLFSLRYLLPEEYFWPFYVPFIFLIAGRMGALLQLLHEAAHSMLSKSKKVNDFVGRWFCALPVGVNFEGYVTGHLRHHAYTGTENEPETDYEKYRISDTRSPKLYLLLMKDLMGLTALFVFFSYTKGKDNRVRKEVSSKLNWLNLCLNMFKLGATQMIILAVIFQFQVFDYILLWIIPAVSPHMFLMRIRGIAEHGLSKQIGVETSRTSEGMFYTRSLLTSQSEYRYQIFNWIERILIGSLAVNYHHEHHLFPKVPFYNLTRLHKYISSQVVQKNPSVYASGYFAATMKNLLSESR